MADNRSGLKNRLRDKLLSRVNHEKLWLNIDIFHMDKHGVQQPRGSFAYYDDKRPDGDFAPRSLFGILITTVDQEILGSVQRPEGEKFNGWVAGTQFASAIRAAVLARPGRDGDWTPDKKKTSWACFKELTIKEAEEINKRRANNRLLQSEGG